MVDSVVVLLSVVCLGGLADAFSTRRCLFFNKACVDHCPRNMHPYHTRCDGQTMSQRTCSSQTTYVLGYTCGWSRCDCNGNMALNEDLGYCVDVFECPPLLSRRVMRRGRRKEKKAFHVPKVKPHELELDPDLDNIRAEQRG